MCIRSTASQRLFLLHYRLAAIRKGKEICPSSVRKGPCGLTNAFYGCEKVEKTFWSCDLFIFQREFTYSAQLKGMQSTKLST